MKKILCIAAVLLLFSTSLPLLADGNYAAAEIDPAPWSGDWWPRSRPSLFKGWSGNKPGPLAKYDNYVTALTGRNPGAVAWESNPRNNHYNPNAADWEGHCNGWAAASIMTAEPTVDRTRGGINFTVADQKALLTEQWMNCYCNFYGNRYWGNSGDDMDDIYPDEFHRLLEKYIDTGKSAIICDIQPDEMVWNFPLYKYESSWSESWFDDSKIKVKTTCWYVNDDVKPNFIGTRSFAVRYTYNLYLDEKGNIEYGEWTGKSRSNHPDFVWVPTSDAPNPKKGNLENPCLNPKYVKRICEGPANERSEHVEPAVNRTPDDVLRKAGLDPDKLFN